MYVRAIFKALVSIGLVYFWAWLLVVKLRWIDPPLTETWLIFMVIGVIIDIKLLEDK